MHTHVRVCARAHTHTHTHVRARAHTLHKSDQATSMQHILDNADVDDTVTFKLHNSKSID